MSFSRSVNWKWYACSNFYIFKIIFDRTLIDTITQYLICLKCTRRCIFFFKCSKNDMYINFLKKQGRTVVYVYTMYIYIYRSLDLHVVILMTIGFGCTFFIRSDSLYLENTCTSYKNDCGVCDIYGWKHPLKTLQIPIFSYKYNSLHLSKCL